MSTKAVLRELQLKYLNEMEKFQYERINTIHRIKKGVDMKNQCTITEQIQGVDIRVGYMVKMRGLEFRNAHVQTEPKNKDQWTDTDPYLGKKSSGVQVRDNQL